jgi:hypothetical protein
LAKSLVTIVVLAALLVTSSEHLDELYGLPADRVSDFAMHADLRVITKKLIQLSDVGFMYDRICGCHATSPRLAATSQTAPPT